MRVTWTRASRTKASWTKAFRTKASWTKAFRSKVSWTKAFQTKATWTKATWTKDSRMKATWTKALCKSKTKMFDEDTCVSYPVLILFVLLGLCFSNLSPLVRLWPWSLVLLVWSLRLASSFQWVWGTVPALRSRIANKRAELENAVVWPIIVAVSEARENIEEMIVPLFQIEVWKRRNNGTSFSVIALIFGADACLYLNKGNFSSVMALKVDGVCWITEVFVPFISLWFLSSGLLRISI